MRIPEYKQYEVEVEQEKLGFYATKWWQAKDTEDNLLAETSVRTDFEDLDLVGQESVTFYRLYEKKEMLWVEERPFPIDEKWRAIEEFPLYEMTKNGSVRLIETKERLQPTLIGDEGYLGFLLKKGEGMHLKSMYQMVADTFPDTFPELLKGDADD